MMIWRRFQYEFKIKNYNYVYKKMKNQFNYNCNYSYCGCKKNQAIHSCLTSFIYNLNPCLSISSLAASNRSKFVSKLSLSFNLHSLHTAFQKY